MNFLLESCLNIQFISNVEFSPLLLRAELASVRQGRLAQSLHVTDTERWGSLKRANAELPWWSSGKESTCGCGRPGFDPLSGKIPHAAEHLSPWTAAAEPTL